MEDRECFKVEKISLRGPGVVILTGPSSCGKGEVAAALSQVMSIPKQNHLSMGEILRSTIAQAKENPEFADLLATRYEISAQNNLFNCIDTTPELMIKAHKHLPRMQVYFNRDNMREFTSQLEWLEYCTMNGLLVPDRWTQSFIAAHIEHEKRFQHEAFIIDGYPRTVAAAEHLLGALKTQGIPVIKVLHLSISKQEMISRASGRGRGDDSREALLSRFQFYIEHVQPSVDYMKTQLGHEAIALIDAHQPVYTLDQQGNKILDLPRSITRVAAVALRNLGVPRVIVRDMFDDLVQQRLAEQNNKVQAAAV